MLDRSFFKFHMYKNALPNFQREILIPEVCIQYQRCVTYQHINRVFQTYPTRPSTRTPTQPQLDFLISQFGQSWGSSWGFRFEHILFSSFSTSTQTSTSPAKLELYRSIYIYIKIYYFISEPWCPPLLRFSPLYSQTLHMFTLSYFFSILTLPRAIHAAHICLSPVRLLCTIYRYTTPTWAILMDYLDIYTTHTRVNCTIDSCLLTI
jgi:hypothetical protein